MRRIMVLTVGWLCLCCMVAAWGSQHGAHCQEHPSSQPQERQTWADPLTGMEFILIPGGCFQMGSPADEEGRSPDESPLHKVCIDDLWMGKQEVTVAQFRAFVEATGYRTEAERAGFAWGYDGDWIKKPGNSWKSVGFGQTGNHPVVNVSWDDASAMAQWLSQKGHGRFRLPTEAEWEYACRAGSQTARFWGGTADEACQYANVADLTAREHFPAWIVHNCQDGFIYTAPCGSFLPNGFGLTDMVGNAAEWVADAYREDSYTGHSEKSPRVESSDSSRMVRGGSWLARSQAARCGARDHLLTTTRRSNDLGFRLVRIP